MAGIRPKKLKQVLLLIELLGGYNEAVLNGIGRYANVAGNWHCVGLTAEREALRALRHQRPDGIIAAFRDPDMAEAVARRRIPLVEVSDFFPPLRFPRVLPDHAAIGRMAAAHLLECGLKSFGFARDICLPWARLRLEGFTARILQAGYRCWSFNPRSYQRQDAFWAFSTPDLPRVSYRRPIPHRIIPVFWRTLSCASRWLKSTLLSGILPVTPGLSSRP